MVRSHKDESYGRPPELRIREMINRPAPWHSTFSHRRDRTQGRSAQPALGAGKSGPVYNLFRHKLMPDLFCAVPQDCPVPGFIEGSAWAFAGTVSERTFAPAGLDWEIAAKSVRRSGFCMFESSLHEARESSVRQDGWSDLRDALSRQVGREPVQDPGRTCRPPL